MPKTKVGETPAEKRRKEVGYRIEDEMRRGNYDNDRMAAQLGTCVKTFIDKKKHRPEDFTLAEIWRMEALFGCKITEPLRKVET